MSWPLPRGRWRFFTAGALLGVLVCTTLLLVAGAAFTLWAAIHFSCAPLGEVFCCLTN